MNTYIHTQNILYIYSTYIHIHTYIITHTPHTYIVHTVHTYIHTYTHILVHTHTFIHIYMYCTVRHKVAISHHLRTLDMEENETMSVGHLCYVNPIRIL